MSGVVSGIGKVFSSVGSTVAKVGKAVVGVGATAFTAGAASSAPPLASGGLAGFVQKFTGTGVLGNVLTGAVTQAGYGALIGAVTGAGAGKGALIGGITGGLMGGAGLNPDPLTKGFGRPPDAVSGNGLGAGTERTGLVKADTPTGVTPTGKTRPSNLPASPVDPVERGPVLEPPAGTPGGVDPVVTSSTGTAPAAPATAPAKQGGLLSGLFSGEKGGQVIAGLGKGLMAGYAAKQQAEQAQRDRDLRARLQREELDYLIEKEQRIRDSYSVDPSVHHQPASLEGGRPTPAQKFSRTRYRYDPSLGQVVPVSA